MHEVTILDTSLMVGEFELALGYTLSREDLLEVFKQLFFILEKNVPLDLTDRNILSYDSLVFANHLNVDHTAVDAIAYHLMVKTWQLMRERGLYINNELRYFPFCMQARDLCVRYYKD